MSKNIVWTQTLFLSFKDGAERRPFNSLRDGSQTTGLRTAVRRQLGAKHEWFLGVEYFAESYRAQLFRANGQDLGVIFSNNEEKRRYGNLFAQ